MLAVVTDVFLSMYTKGQSATVGRQCSGTETCIHCFSLVGVLKNRFWIEKNVTLHFIIKYSVLCLVRSLQIEISS